MKLMIVIVRDVDAAAVVDRLVSEGYRVTRIASTGAFYDGETSPCSSASRRSGSRE